MDSLRLPNLQASILCGLLALVLTLPACRQDDNATNNLGQEAAPPSASFSPLSLRVPLDQLSRIELSRQGARTIDRRIVLEKANDAWRITAPIDYPANQNTVDPIVAVLAELEITSAIVGNGNAAREHRLEPTTGIEIKAWAGNRLASHFLVGSSTREETFVKQLEDPRIFTVRGRCRPLFDRTLEQLRHPIITAFSATEIEGVEYQNAFGGLELVADPKAPGRFVPKGTPIRNFDADRATKDVGVLANLHAQGFVDAPANPAVTGLFDDACPRAKLLLRDERGSRSVDVWVGSRTPDGRLHLRTSESKQIYLVSSHLESSLVARRSHFERTEEMMRQLEAHRATSEGHGTTASSPHTHGLPKALPTQVPPELLRDLRALAKEQRASR